MSFSSAQDMLPKQKIEEENKTWGARDMFNSRSYYFCAKERQGKRNAVSYGRYAKQNLPKSNSIVCCLFVQFVRRFKIEALTMLLVFQCDT